jgi:mono/diheme cytochrome c family protein
MNPIIQLLSIGGLALLLGGCGGPSDFTPAADMSAADIYNETCQVCHGENGAGKFGFLFKIQGTDSSLEQMAAALKEGGSIMPSYPNFSDQQHMMMAAYVKSL